MSERKLTTSDAVRLAQVIDACIRGARVRWQDEKADALLEGVMRSIGHEDSTFLRADEDVRDGFVRITLSSGFDYYMPMVEALRLTADMLMAFDPS